jgi:hypothetical protein
VIDAVSVEVVTVVALAAEAKVAVVMTVLGL